MTEEKTHKRCLLLNADYTPISIISWKRAIFWSMKYMDSQENKIEILDFYGNDFIQCSHDKKLPVPCIAKTSKYFRFNHQKAVFSRKNIFLRDNFTCQYCGIKYSPQELTYDHIVPKSVFRRSNTPLSATTWTNITTACLKCNRKKGNRTPKEANMTLLSLPIQPKQNNRYLSIIHHLSKIKEDSIPESWRIYLPTSYTLGGQNNENKPK
jgi:5-methylcytosine-specific restriction endonuclease McrA